MRAEFPPCGYLGCPIGQNPAKSKKSKRNGKRTFCDYTRKSGARETCPALLIKEKKKKKKKTNEILGIGETVLDQQRKR